MKIKEPYRPWVKFSYTATPPTVTHLVDGGRQTLCGSWLASAGYLPGPDLEAANSYCKKCKAVMHDRERRTA